MSSIVRGFFFGLGEFYTAPMGLWHLHKLVTTHYSVSKRKKRPSVGDPSTSGLHDQALRRQQISLAMGEQQPSVSPVMESTSRAQVSESPTVNLLLLFAKICFINVAMVIVLWTFLYTLSLIARTRLGLTLYSFTVVHAACNAVTYILESFIFLLMQFVNLIYLKKICARIVEVQRQRFAAGYRKAEGIERRLAENVKVLGRCEALLGSSTKSESIAGPNNPFSSSSSSSSLLGFSKSFVDNIVSLLFFFVYCLQWRLVVYLMPYGFLQILIDILSNSLIYGCYAFDYYARLTSDTSTEVILTQVVNFWPVVTGYGLPLGVLVWATSGLMGVADLVTAFVYPVLVVGAFQVAWSRGLDPHLHRAPTGLRAALALSMRVPLRLTHALMGLGVAIAQRFSAKK